MVIQATVEETMSEDKNEDKYLAGLLLAILRGIRKIVLGTPRSLLKIVFMPVIDYLLSVLKKLRK